MKDHTKQEQYVSDSGLTWTVVRPGAFTDGPLTQDYFYGFSPTEKDISLDISRQDVADFMIQQLATEANLNGKVGLSYRKSVSSR